MDIKRLVLFVIFSFSVMMLWDSWQVKNSHQNEVAADASTVGATTVDASFPAAADAASITQVDNGQFKLATGKRVSVSTDLYKAEISTIAVSYTHLTLPTICSV